MPNAGSLVFGVRPVYFLDRSIYANVGAAAVPTRHHQLYYRDTRCPRGIAPLLDCPRLPKFLLLYPTFVPRHYNSNLYFFSSPADGFSLNSSLTPPYNHKTLFSILVHQLLPFSPSPNKTPREHSTSCERARILRVLHYANTTNA